MSKISDLLKGMNTLTKVLEDNCRDEVKARLASEKPIDLSEYKEMTLNSYERFLLFPLLSNEALIFNMENALKQVKTNDFEIPKTYDDFLRHQALPMMMERFKELIEETSPQGKIRKLLVIKPK